VGARLPAQRSRLLFGSLFIDGRGDWPTKDEDEDEYAGMEARRFYGRRTPCINVRGYERFFGLE